MSAQIAATTEEYSAVQIPAGMVEVSKEVFWKHVTAEKRDVMPFPKKYHTDWCFTSSRQHWGWVSQGYMGPFDYHKDAPPVRFALVHVEGRS